MATSLVNARRVIGCAFDRIVIAEQFMTALGTTHPLTQRA